MARPAAKRAKLGKAYTLLVRRYGLPARRRGRGALDVLIATILSQSTTGANSSAGFRNLKRRFGSWDKLADARVTDIRRCISCCGLGRIKAPRIRKIVRAIRAERGQADLRFLRRRSPEAAYEYLISFDGVGPKTALCVMMFALGMKVFPVDTHVTRITRRLGVLPDETPTRAAHEALTPLIRPDRRYATHMLLIDHGRAVCRSAVPLCDGCVLLGLCPHGSARLRRGE